MTVETKLYDERAEMALIGALALDASALHDVASFLVPDHFYLGKLRKIYEAMLALSMKGEPVDVVSIADHLAPNTDDYAVTVIEAMNSVPTSVNAYKYGRIVESYGLRRALVRAASEVATQAHDVSADIQEVLSAAEREVFNVGQRRLADTAKSARAAVADYLEQLDDDTTEAGIDSGLQSLDRIVRGWRRGRYYIVAARPGMGKSAFALQAAMRAASLGNHTAIFTLEMTADELMERAISSAARINNELLEEKRLTPEQRATVDDIGRQLAEMPLVIDDEPRLTPVSLRAKCLRMKALHGLDLVIVDHAHLMDARGRFANDNAKHEHISREMKKIAKETGVAIIVLAQLNRSVESRANKRPMLSDLRSSGGYEQDANVVMFIYREGYYDEAADEPNVCEFIVAKNRGGRTGVATAFWKGHITRFYDVAHEKVHLNGRPS